MPHDPPDPSAVTASNPDETVIGYEDDIYDVPSTTAGQSPDEIVLENEIETVVPLPLALHETKFLALDKCLSRFQFLEAGPCSFLVVRKAYASIFLSLQIVDTPTKEEEPPGEEHATIILSYDPEWLAITRAFQPYLSRKREQAAYPDPDGAREWVWVYEHALPELGAEFRIDACQRFAQEIDGAHQQTDAFVALFGIENVVR